MMKRSRCSPLPWGLQGSARPGARAPTPAGLRRAAGRTSTHTDRLVHPATRLRRCLRRTRRRWRPSWPRGRTATTKRRWQTWCWKRFGRSRRRRACRSCHGAGNGGGGGTGGCCRPGWWVIGMRFVAGGMLSWPAPACRSREQRSVRAMQSLCTAEAAPLAGRLPPGRSGGLRQRLGRAHCSAARRPRRPPLARAPHIPPLTLHPFAHACILLHLLTLLPSLATNPLHPPRQSPLHLSDPSCPRPRLLRAHREGGDYVPDELDPKVVEVYQGVGKVLSRYTSGKVRWGEAGN